MRIAIALLYQKSSSVRSYTTISEPIAYVVLGLTCFSAYKLIPAIEVLMGLFFKNPHPHLSALFAVADCRHDHLRIIVLLCATSVFSVSLWLERTAKDFTTETQRTQRSHRENPLKLQ